MKSVYYRHFGFLLTVAMVLTMGCSKDEKISGTPLPDAPAPNEAAVQLVIDLPGQSAITGARAILVLHKAGQEKIVKVSLTEQGNKMHTGPIVLDDGEYDLTQLKITDKNGVYLFAVPRAQSAKANEVNTPLNIRFSANSEKPLLNITATAIGGTNNALDFGYPMGAFENQDQFSIKLKATINVGGYIYDNMDGQLTLTWYDAAQQPHTEQIQLKAGDNSIALVKNATRYVFDYRKWNVTDQMDMPADAITPDMTIIIGGTVKARKLSEEKTWHFNDFINELYSRKTYTYNSKDQLVKTLYYQKIPQYQDLQLQQIHAFEYQLGRLMQVKFLDRYNMPYGYIKFTYNNNGFVTNMEQKSYDQFTYAAVDYAADNGKVEVTIDYLYDNGHSLEYKYWLENGNKTRETGRSSTGSSEGGTYQYDNFINPYYLLGVQDIFLRYNSRNNLLEQAKGYTGGFPTLEPYQFDYSYDEAGYPVQLMKKFRSYPSGNHMYTEKTVYTYKD